MPFLYKYKTKTFGQNFLVDEAVAERIVQAADISSADTVLEIGPGRGALTKMLAEKSGRVVAVEVDKKLVAELREKFSAVSNLEIVDSDALTVSESVLRLPENYLLVANLPYASGTAILRRFLEKGPRPRRAVVMLQLEVAERLVAAPPRETLLSIAVQLFGQPKIIFRVPPSAFSPQPKVDSAVLDIRLPERNELLHNLDVAKFFTVLKSGFSAPRKKLRNNLKKIVSAEDVGQILRSVGQSADARPAELSVEQWVALVEALS